MKKNFTQMTQDEFKIYIETGNVTLIDVRRDEERLQYWQIRDDQKNIILWADDFELKIRELNKSKRYAVYCWHGKRSITVRDYMQELGFEYVVDLEGGIDKWGSKS